MVFPGSTTDMTPHEVMVQPVPIQVFYAACALCAAGYLLTSIFIAFNIKYRNTRIVRMSSANVNLVLAFGAYLAYLCCVLASLGALVHINNIHIAPCQGLTWLAPIAFTLVFGAMFTKSWRVRRIFLKAPHRKVVVKDYILFLIVCFLLLIDIVLLTTWQSIDPLRVTLVRETIAYNITHQTGQSPSLQSPITQITLARNCVSDYSFIWLSAIFVYKTLVLLYGVYLSWTVRAVTLPAMNDTTAIILSSLLTAFVAMATAVTSVWFRREPVVTSSLTMAAIWVCTTVTLSLNFIPKMMLVFNNAENELLRVTLASQVIYSPNQSLDQVEDEIYHLVAENRGLKKALTQKEEKIRALQDHVTTAKVKLETLITEDKQDSGLDPDLSSSSNQGDDANDTTGYQQTTSVSQPNRQHATQPVATVEERRESSDSGQPDEDSTKNFGIYTKCGGGRDAWTNRGNRISRETQSSVAARISRLRSTDSGSRTSLQSISKAWLKFSWRRPSLASSQSTANYRGVRMQPNPFGPPSMSLDQYQRGRFRDSLGDLAHELDTVDYLSSALRQSLNHDLEQSMAHSRSSVVYDQVRTKQDIAGSIIDSYDLDHMSETFSYVSNHMSTSTPNYPRPVRSRYGYTNSSATSRQSTLQRASSAESVSTIANDRYYPSRSRGQFVKGGGAAGGGSQLKRYGQRNGFRHESKPNIFTVSGPKVEEPGVNILYDEGTYV